jgi:hypothetical protein
MASNSVAATTPVFVDCAYRRKHHARSAWKDYAVIPRPVATDHLKPLSGYENLADISHRCEQGLWRSYGSCFRAQKEIPGRILPANASIALGRRENPCEY